MTNKQFLRDNKCELQVTKLMVNSDRSMRDLETFAYDIINAGGLKKVGCNCAIFKVETCLVLMRNVGKHEIVRTWQNGQYVEIEYEFANQHPSTNIDLNKRELVKKYLCK